MKKSISFISALATLVLAGCQKNEINNRGDLGNATVKYAVATSMTTKSVAAGEFASEESGEAEGIMQVLSDASGSLSIPMVAEVTEGIYKPVTKVPTKGTLVNTTSDDYKTLGTFADIVGTFYAKAYDTNGSEKVFQTVTWDESSSAWVGSPVAYWPQATNLNFLAYANLPSGQAATIALDGVSTSHTVPATAAEQTDILFGHYSGNGGNTGTAEIRFEHPLTAVRFLRGEIDDDLVIKSICIKGVAESGTATMAPDGEISWSGVGAHDFSVSMEGDATTGLELSGLDGYSAQFIDEPFIIIPQDLADNAVDVIVTFSDGSEVTATLTSGEWKAGCTNIYTLGYGTASDYLFNAIDEEGQVIYTPTLVMSNTSTDSDQQKILISSLKIKEGISSAHPWNIKSYKVGTSDPVTVGGTSFTAGGLTVDQDGNYLKVTAATRTSSASSHDYWTNKDGISGDSDGSGWSPADWSSTKATASNPLDLSMFDPYTDTKDAHGMTTANCYIIRHAGTYKLPLVYGNAVVDGEVNEQSYYPNCKGDIPDGDDATKNNRLVKFQNCFGEDITSAFIENDGDCGGEDLKCAIIWQDMAEVVTNLRLSTDAADAGTIYNKDNVRYLVFDVPLGSICQNNALICIYKDRIGGTTDKYDSGEAIWSWHIWTTNDPAVLSDPIPVTNFTNVEYDFFPLYNIGFIDTDRYPSLPDVKIVLQQQVSGKEIEISVSQLAVAGGKSNGCFYQFGRKDPIPSTATNPVGFSVAQGPATLSSAIQNPGVFYKKSYDWCSSHYYNLWTGKKSATGLFEQDDDLIKTIYDPSPVGYKLPASRAFTGFTDTGDIIGTAPINCNVYGPFKSGWTFYSKPGKQGETMYFPASGYRKNTDGSVSMVGYIGDYWTAVSASDIYGHYLYTFTTHVSPTNGFDRAYGIMVRPVLE